MMQYYGLEKIKLKHIEIFTEAYKGYCHFEVYSAKISVNENNSVWYQDPKIFGIIGFSFIFVCILIYYFLKEYALKKKKRAEGNGVICLRSPLSNMVNLNTYHKVSDNTH